MKDNAYYNASLCLTALCSNTIANNSPKQQGEGESVSKFENNRPEAMQMRSLREMANNSPQVKQFKAYQGMVNSSPQAVQLQAMAGNHTDEISSTDNLLGKVNRIHASAVVQRIPKNDDDSDNDATEGGRINKQFNQAPVNDDDSDDDAAEGARNYEQFTPSGFEFDDNDDQAQSMGAKSTEQQSTVMKPSDEESIGKKMTMDDNCISNG